MKFRQRLLISLAIPLAIVVALGGAAAYGVTAFEGGLARYLAHEDALAQAAGEISPATDCDELAAFFWIGWEGAVLRAKLDRHPAALKIFADGFFTSVTSR